MNENTVALTRTVAYKKNVDAKTNSLIENGTELFNSVAYQRVFLYPVSSQNLI